MKKTFYNIIFLTLVVVAVALTERVQAQSPCEISCDSELPVCSGTKVVLSVPENEFYRYRWMPGNDTTCSITVRPTATTTYSVFVTDTLGGAVCDNSITVSVWPLPGTRMRQLRLTCNNNENDNGRTAQIKVDVEEGYGPYSYYWEEGFGSNRWYELSPMHIAPTDPSVAIGLKAYKWYRVEVTDSRGCVKYDSIYTKAYPTPVVEIFCDPADTLFLQNPDATFSFENHSEDTLAVDHFFWTFEHDITSTQERPVFTYVEQGTFYASLTVYDELGCDTVFMKEIYVNPVKLKIPSVFTPNGDGVNDTFVISLSGGSDNPSSGNNTRANADEHPLNDYYKTTELMVMNRWGRVVYHSTDYQNDWDGGGLHDGTYFYILKCKGLKEEVQYQGAVMIITKSRQ